MLHLIMLSLLFSLLINVKKGAHAWTPWATGIASFRSTTTKHNIPLKTKTVKWIFLVVVLVYASQINIILYNCHRPHFRKDWTITLLMLFYILPNCIKNLLAVIIRSELFCNITDRTYIINILLKFISDGINRLVLLYFFDN